jgi:hypothetical protein
MAKELEKLRVEIDALDMLKGSCLRKSAFRTEISNIDTLLKCKTSGHNLTNVIKEPTRNGALLDPILVSNLDIVIDSEVSIIIRGVPIFMNFVVH